MPAKKKAETESQAQSEEAVEETPAGAFESHIKDGPTQDDLNPAYAPPPPEGADEDSDKDKDE